MGEPTGVDEVSDETYLSVTKFYSMELMLLDSRSFTKWLALLTDDARYVILGHVHQDAARSPTTYPIFDEDAVSLRARVTQIATPKLTHAENPPSLTRRFVSGLLLERDEPTDGVVARTNVLLYMTRHDSTEPDFYVGQRTDRLRRMDKGWRIAERRIALDRSSLSGFMSVIL